MKIDEHALLLGQTLGHLYSLDSILRTFLQGLPGAAPLGLPAGASISSFRAGAAVPLSDATSQEALGQLIERFNREMARRGRKPLDPTLVDLRDALVHGRLASAALTGELHLMRFSKPAGKAVTVVFNEKLDYSWLTRQKASVRAAIEQVQREF